MQLGRLGWGGSGKRGARAWCPALEQLESRLAPAIYHVSTFQDTPAVDATTGQDAAGNVSLRSAVAAANANPQTDTILLAAGAYTAPAGGLAIQGNLLIHGDGPASTIIQAQLLDHLFSVDKGGHLDLSGLDLEGGSAAALLQGDVHVTDCRISDADVAAVVRARLSSGQTTPVLDYSPLTPTARDPEIPKPIQLPETPETLAKRSGGASSWQPADLSQQERDAHQTFWRGETEPAPEQAVPGKPDDAKPKAPSREESQSGATGWHALSIAIGVETHPRSNQALRDAPGAPPGSLSPSAKELVALARWESDAFLNAHANQWFGVQEGQGLALVAFFAFGVGSLPKPGKSALEKVRIVTRERQARPQRWRKPRESQRGPPLGWRRGQTIQ